MSSSEKEIDALYGLPLEEFTKERNDLADALRSKGDRQAADRVKALVKPKTAAWAVNQVMRTQPKDARALLDAGERLRDVHEGVTSGTATAGDLREAVEAEREAVGRLTDAARGLVNTQGRGLSESVLERVAQTLHALSTDSEIRSVADATRLSGERMPASASFAPSSSEGRPRRPASPTGTAKGQKVGGGGVGGGGAKSRKGASAARIRKARDRLERAKREARDLRSSRTRAARATSDAERALVSAREKMRKADQKVEDKESEIKELRRRLEQLG